MPHNIIHKYLDEIDDIQEVVEKRSEKILELIDMEELLKNPQEFLLNIAQDFYELHSDELDRSIKAGEKQARAIINKYA